MTPPPNIFDSRRYVAPIYDALEDSLLDGLRFPVLRAEAAVAAAPDGVAGGVAHGDGAAPVWNEAVLSTTKHELELLSHFRSVLRNNPYRGDAIPDGGGSIGTVRDLGYLPLHVHMRILLTIDLLP